MGLEAGCGADDKGDKEATCGADKKKVSELVTVVANLTAVTEAPTLTARR